MHEDTPDASQPARLARLRRVAAAAGRSALVLLILTLSLATLRSASGPDPDSDSSPATTPLADTSAYNPALVPTALPTPPTLGERTLQAMPHATAPPPASSDMTSNLPATATIEPCTDAACTTPTPPALDSTSAPQPTATPAPAPAPVLEVRTMIDADTRARLAQRSTDSWDALQEAFFDTDMQQYRERANGAGWPPYAYLWPLSQVVAAGNDLARLPTRDDADDNTGMLLELLALTERYFDADRSTPGYSSYLLPPYGDGGDRYYDDNVWLGLELLRAYELTGHPVALERATEVLNFMLSGWDSDPAHHAMGGIAWIENDNNGNRNTVSTAPTIELALRLSTYTDDPDRQAVYWSWATRLYGWMNANLQADNGMYWDHVRADGIIDTTLHSYNQGAMIGANVWLYRVSGERVYLDRAINLAEVSSAWFRNGGRDDQPIAFNALYFRRLLELNDLRPTQAWVDLVLDEADLLWTRARDRDSGLMTTSAPLTLLDQAAAVQIFGMLAGYGLSPLDDSQPSAP